MKKVFVLVVMLITLVATVPAHAESIDLEALSLDELVTLRNRITDIISTQTVSSENEIFSGGYIVGEKIKPGKYILTFVRLVEDCSHGKVSLLHKDESGVYFYDEVIGLSIGEEYYLDLTEGMKIYIDDGVGIIRETVKPFWEP